MDIVINGDKYWYKSKTLWVNFLVLLGSFLGELTGYLQSGGALTTLALINMLLRVVTKQKIRFVKGE